MVLAQACCRLCLRCSFGRAAVGRVAAGRGPSVVRRCSVLLEPCCLAAVIQLVVSLWALLVLVAGLTHLGLDEVREERLALDPLGSGLVLAGSSLVLQSPWLVVHLLFLVPRVCQLGSLEHLAGAHLVDQQHRPYLAVLSY